MRIVGGEFRGRKFIPPVKKWPTRPTTDFAKEALFNILNNRIDFESTIMLDLFGGTGNHCYEFISRGCQQATYVDNFRACVDFVHKTADTLKIANRLSIVRSDVFKFIKKTPKQFNYIIADPPYALRTLADIPDLVFDNNLLLPDGLLVLEHDSKNDFSSHDQFLEVRKYGSTLFTFFKE